jgi:hypothetical protein
VSDSKSSNKVSSVQEAELFDLKMKALIPSESTADFYQTTRRYLPDGSTPLDVISLCIYVVSLIQVT